MGTLSRLVPGCKLTLMRGLLRGSAGLLHVNCLKGNNSRDTELDPIMLGILSRFLLETEGSCVFLKGNTSVNTHGRVIACDFSPRAILPSSTVKHS